MTGNTSYQTLPFAGTIFAQSWCSSPTLSPANLFWQQGANFKNLTNMANARVDAAAKTKAGIVPTSGCQRWDDTYAASLPAVIGEPGYITADRATIMASGEQAAFTAWANWIKARPSMVMLNDDGTPNANGHISPLMPLSPADWPAGIGAVYGDLFASQWSQTSGLSGAYGIVLSDYSDSQPIGPSYATGFNPEIIAAFASSIGRSITGSSVSACAQTIIDGYFNEWTDFLCAGYARFFGTLASCIEAACDTPSLVVDQCGLSPSQRRLYGVDARYLAAGMDTDNVICLWDNQTFQVGRSGQPMIWSLTGAVMAAAREPNIRNGANLECDTPAFAAACAAFYSTLDAATQRERGLKDIKRNWLENGFAHIADRGGAVRRALCFVSRDYWDVGKLDPAIATLIQTIIPTKPFGYGVYYSTDCEAQDEQLAALQSNLNACYMTPDKLVAFKQAGGAVGYYVSDAARMMTYRPAAWVILDGALSKTEQAAIGASVPVLTSAQALTWAKAPLKFSAGVTGFAFYDQTGRLIIVATNTTSATVQAKITISPAPAKANQAQELFTKSAVDLTKPVSIARWDTLLIAVAS